MDTVSSDVRSKIMSKIKSKNTSPEILLRKTLWSKGLRYRIHDKTILGTPDVSNKSKKIAIFVDGCFWHGCPKCYKTPKSNVDYWTQKLFNNINRRKKVKTELTHKGWKIFEFWECDILNNSKKIMNSVHIIKARSEQIV